MEWIDLQPNSLVEFIMAAFKPVLTKSECYSNLKQMLCSSFFRECRPVEDPVSQEMLYLPSLMCRSECERRTEIWNQCVDEISQDPQLYAAFETVLKEANDGFGNAAKRFLQKGLRGDASVWSPFRFTPCDATGGVLDDIEPGDEVSAFLFGRYPYEAGQNLGILPLDFPPGVDTAALFPEVSSTYTDADGTAYEVQCFVSEEAQEEEFLCPHPFLNSVNQDTRAECVKACPVPAYTLSEYDGMWLAATVPAAFGFFLNTFMICTWILGGRKHFHEQPFAVKVCVLGGIFYNLVDTLPVLALKYDLPCTNATEEGIGSSALCAINRLSRYILLSIMFALATLTFNLWMSIRGDLSRRNLAGLRHYLGVLSIAAPFTLCVIAYIMESEENTKTGVDAVNNAVLNVSRHAFNCSMRFSNMVTEWALLWVHFLWSGIMIIVFASRSWWIIRRAELKIGENQETHSAHAKARTNTSRNTRRRLLAIAVMVCLCVLINTVVTVLTSSTLEEWSVSADLWLQCTLFETKYSRDWGAYGFEEGQSVCGPQRVNDFQGSTSCVQPCTYWAFDDTVASKMVCMINDGPFDYDPSNALTDYTYCSCPCEDMVEQERPSAAIVTLSFLVQSVVQSIVPLVLGFRETNLKIWKRYFTKSEDEHTYESKSDYD